MSLIQTPWTSQPQQAVGIDTGSGLLVRSAWVGSSPLMVHGVGAVSAYTATNIAFDVPSKVGRAVSFTNSAGTNIVYAADADLALPTNNCTIAILRRCRDTTNRDATIIGYMVSATDMAQVVAPYTDGNFYFDFGTSGTTGRLSVAYTKDTEWETIVCVAGSSKGREIWRRGVKLAGNATKTATRSATSLALRVGSKTTGDTCDNQDIALICIAHKEWSDSEIRSWCSNPWQIFKPLPLRIFVPVSAATGDATGTGSFYDVTLSSPSATATGSALATGSLPAVSTTAPSATATGSALATGALTTVTLTTITASATGSALATGSLDAIDLSTVSGSATGTTAGNAEGVGSVAAIALSAPAASAVGSALATGSFAHVSLSAVSGTASAATNGQATADLQPISISAPLAIAIASSVATGGIQSIGLTAPNASASGQAQTIARPGSDTSNSGWTPSTGTDLYAMLDEVTPNDADYISTASAGSVCRLGLGAVADPGTSSGQVVSYRASSSTGNGLKVELMQGGTVIATWNHASLPATDTTYQQSLSAAECDAITDYTALSVRLTSL